MILNNLYILQLLEINLQTIFNKLKFIFDIKKHIKH